MKRIMYASITLLALVVALFKNELGWTDSGPSPPHFEHDGANNDGGRHAEEKPREPSHVRADEGAGQAVQQQWCFSLSADDPHRLYGNQRAPSGQ